MNNTNTKYLRRTIIIIFLKVLIVVPSCTNPIRNSSDPHGVLATPFLVTATVTAYPPPSESPPTTEPTLGIQTPSLAVTTEPRLRYIYQKEFDFSGWLIYAQWSLPRGLYIIHTTGKGQRLLLDLEGYYFQPEWSPDRNWIAFIADLRNRDKPTSFDLYIVKPDGTMLTRLTNGTPQTNVISIAWANDSKKIIFSQSNLNPDLPMEDIFIVDIDSIQVEQITDTLDAVETFPAWSPVGNRIAYIVKGPKNLDGKIVVMNVDEGEKTTKVYPFSIGVSRMAWHPTGESIIFQTPDECSDLFSVNLESGIITPVAQLHGSEAFASFSPDGSFISFNRSTACSSERITGRWEISIMNIDSGNWTSLTRDNKQVIEPSWYSGDSLFVGGQFHITNIGSNIILRGTPSLGGEKLQKLLTGTAVEVVEGPVEMDGYLWWKVRTEPDGMTGWLVEIPGWFIRE